MRAFVLSGGANLGPIQVGALQALLEHNITPQMLVGCSAGALNAGYLAPEISLTQVAHLANIWRSVTARDIYPEHRVGALWRLFSGQDSFYSNRNFYAFLQRHGATPVQTFGQTAAVPLYIVVARPGARRLALLGAAGALLVVAAGYILSYRYGAIIGKPFDEYSHVYLAQLSKLNEKSECAAAPSNLHFCRRDRCG